ncbi:FAD-dependent oxidoreductase [Ramlibacter sp. AW1]|uniref:FAD-dependent oxidoreductase n=1 Tax=Ramlibacter aurantiacus TaxID=2801330 RepID=A0A936ZRM8_9BURK|nr:hydroxysqualene dehydroxylase HpnE [Ramlibacter aurantiacus]MBL0419805.1 FAD-dependent oxidoreductase [Ramlibacter aurantiacus]
MRVAVIGAGWAGIAAAVQACSAGHAVTLFEAARQLGGRARSLSLRLTDGQSTEVDNGQHILIGGYTETLSLMQRLGVAPEDALLAMPLELRGPQGEGLSLPRWPPPADFAWGVLTAKGWTLRDKLGLLRTAAAWRRAGFRCDPGETVLSLSRHLGPRVQADLVEPLCISALNTPPDQACGAVFLRVLQDALLGPGWGRWPASWLLLPRRPLGALLPQAGQRWLQAHGATVRTGHRVRNLARPGSGWRVDEEAFDAVVLAGGSDDAARLVEGWNPQAHWLRQARQLRHRPIATVYAQGRHRLARPMVALRSAPGAPAQFVFDRAQLGGPDGLLAFVVSDSQGTRQEIEAAVIAQARALGWDALRPLGTVVEKRATFACTPGLQRPPPQVAQGLWACGDYVRGPYPATLEGAVRSAAEVVGDLTRSVPTT